jgi:PilZ domain-containing protein
MLTDANNSTILAVESIARPNGRPVRLFDGAPAGDSGTDRRREPRYPCQDPAEVRLVPGDGSSLPATVLDISRSGLRLRLVVRIPKNSQVEIVLPKQVIIFGEVRYCRRSGDNFDVGIFIQDVFYCSPAGGTHLHDDQLSRFLAGKGLITAEVIAVKQHLRTCRLCATRLAEPKLA